MLIMLNKTKSSLLLRSFFCLGISILVVASFSSIRAADPQAELDGFMEQLPGHASYIWLDEQPYRDVFDAAMSPIGEIGIYGDAWNANPRGKLNARKKYLTKLEQLRNDTLELNNFMEQLPGHASYIWLRGIHLDAFNEAMSPTGEIGVYGDAWNAKPRGKLNAIKAWLKTHRPV
ncbi:MAG: hypothetical protein NWQ29_03530 [Alphaproteobacteria bacterium]|nr:hypothetical protein [Alphaproteobacteria bacterium]